MPRCALILSLAVVLLLSGGVRAQSEERPLNSPPVVSTGSPQVIHTNIYGVGFSMGLGNGLGLSFRHHLKELPYSYMLSSFAWRSSTRKMFAAGGEVQYDLSLRQSGRLYVGIGGGYYNDSGPRESDYYGLVFSRLANTLTDPFRLEGGLGFEFPIGAYFGSSLGASMIYFLRSRDVTILPTMGLHAYFR